MSSHDDLDQALFTAGCKRFEIAIQHRLEGRLILPFGMLRGQCLDPVDGKQKLKIGRLFGP